MKEALVALDLGTSSTRALMIGLDGTILKVAQRPLAIHTPEPGWVEQDPIEMLEGAKQVLNEVLSDKTLKPLSLGITNQRETTIVWHKTTQKPIYPAIVWQDRRTESICQQMSAHQSQIHQKTGLMLDPYFSATKIAWILDHVPNARALAEQGELLFGTVDSYILWHLTKGTHATDMTNASRTSLFNLQTLDWDKQLCELFNVPIEMLPEIKTSDALFGHLEDYANLPVQAMIGDQQSASLGQGCIQAGSLKSTFGTGGFMLLNTGQKIHYSTNQLLTTVGLSTRSRVDFALEGSLFTAGAMMRWLRDNLKLLPDVAQSSQWASEVGLSHEVYMIPALTGLGAPIWDPNARAAFFGMSLDTTAHHLVTACLEAMCFQSKQLVDLFEKESGQKVKQCFVDGGMSINQWFCQHLSHLLEAKIIRPKIVETTSMGATFLAGVGLGLFKLDDVHDFKTIDKIYSPDETHQRMAEKYERWLQYQSMVCHPLTHDEQLKQTSKA